jgi:hypothetical protein
VVLSSAQARRLREPAFSSKPRQMASNLSLIVFYDSRDSFCNVALERIEDLRQTSRGPWHPTGTASPNRPLGECSTDDNCQIARRIDNEQFRQLRRPHWVSSFIMTDSRSSWFARTVQVLGVKQFHRHSSYPIRREVAANSRAGWPRAAAISLQTSASIHAAHEIHLAAIGSAFRRLGSISAPHWTQTP